MGTQAESSFPWKRVGVTSYRISTFLGDLFSQGRGGILTGRLICQRCLWVFAASWASHYLKWMLVPQSQLSLCQVVPAFSITLQKSLSLYWSQGQLHTQAVGRCSSARTWVAQSRGSSPSMNSWHLLLPWQSWASHQINHSSRQTQVRALSPDGLKVYGTPANSSSAASLILRLFSWPRIFTRPSLILRVQSM